MKFVKEFDCVEFQRKTRAKFAEEANMNLDELIKLLDEKISKSDVHLKLIKRLEKEKQLTTA
ncbi:MAG: hypothetical protein WCR42_12730 [bacterium]